MAAQSELELRAKGPIFADASAGVTALKSRTINGALFYYLLTARGTVVVIFDSAGKRVGCIPEGCEARLEFLARQAVPSKPGAKTPPPSAPAGPIVYADDIDVACGKAAVAGAPTEAGKSVSEASTPACFIYVADRGANAIKAFTLDGKLARTFPVAAPTSVIALSEDEIAVATMRGSRLVTVFDRNGKVLREFGIPAELSSHTDLNRTLNAGHMVGDDAGHIYYSFSFLPEPTVRKYDRFGYATLEIELASLDIAPTAQAARREIERLDEARVSRASLPAPRLVVSAIGVDAETQEVWLSVGGLLLHFDPDGGHLGTYRIFTKEGARIEPSAILVEADRLLVASDTLGVFEFLYPPGITRTRPEKPRR